MADAGLFRPEVKSAFDNEIIKEFQAVITQSISGFDRKHKLKGAIWIELGEVLGLSNDQVNRYIQGHKKGNTRPVSPLDGQEDQNPPPLETVFRYIAAKDYTISFPRGREIVNRALAISMHRLHFGRTGERLPLTAAEVERLRFIRQWRAGDMPRPAISSLTVKDMRGRKSDFRALMEPIRLDKEFVEELKILRERWNALFSELAQLTKYEWLNNWKA